MIEHSDLKSTRSVLRNAPAWVVSEVNEARKAEGMSPLEFAGLPNHVGTDSQVAENRKALLLKKYELLQDEADSLE